MLDPLAFRHRVEQPAQLVGAVGRDQRGHAAADHLARRPAVHFLGRAVPARDHAVQGLADDRIGRGLYDRRQFALAAVTDTRQGQPPFVGLDRRERHLGEKLGLVSPPRGQLERHDLPGGEIGREARAPPR